MIKTEGLTKIYGEGELALTVLRGLDIEIAGGEYVAIMGPSGAGKSTLMYQLSLLDDPTSGQVIIDGVLTSDLHEKEKTAIRLNDLGYVFQDYALLPELTSAENVILPLLMQGLSKSEAYTKAHDSLSRVGLADKLVNLPSQLSGGQQQRVAIARAIAHKPKILFADEPTANLDSVSAEPVMEAFADLNSKGQTIVMVTHEDEYANQAKRIITLKDGEIVSDKRTQL